MSKRSAIRRVLKPKAEAKEAKPVAPKEVKKAPAKPRKRTTKKKAE